MMSYGVKNWFKSRQHSLKQGTFAEQANWNESSIDSTDGVSVIYKKSFLGLNNLSMVFEMPTTIITIPKPAYGMAQRNHQYIGVSSKLAATYCPMKKVDLKIENFDFCPPESS